MKRLSIFLFSLLLSLVLSTCQPTAEFDIRGAWDYTMTAADGNTYDIGTITFDGQPTQGTYLQVNIYAVEYEGAFSVDGSTLKLTGDETWQGTITDTNTIEGTWTHEDGISGVFTATRK